MMLRLALVALLLAASNASLLRGGVGGMKHDQEERILKEKNPKEEKGDKRDDTTGGCGIKLSAETMAAFGLPPNMDCNAIAAEQRDDYGCIALPSQIDSSSQCTTTNMCRNMDPTWACYCVPVLSTTGGPAGPPVCNCGTRQGIASVQDTGKGIGVDESVPKELCSDIAIP